MGNEKNNKDAVGVRINVYSIREPIGVYMSSVIESVCSFPCQYTKLDTSAGNRLRHKHVIFSLLALLSEGQKMPPQTFHCNFYSDLDKSLLDVFFLFLS